MENATGYENLLSLENELAKLLGASVFDYVFLFDPKIKLEIKISNLSETAGNLIRAYLAATNTYLKENGVPEIQASTSLEQDFLFALRNNYLIRYTRALALYADYNLTRIPTDVEKKMLEIMKGEQDLTISFYIPDAIVIDESGLVDLSATRKQEQQSRLIAGYLSAAILSDSIADDMFEELQLNSKRQLVFSLFSRELFSAIQKVVQMIMVFFSRTTYQYLQESFSVSSALANSSSYFIKNLQTDAAGNWRLFGLETEATKIIDTELSKLPKINAETKQIVLQEIVQKLLIYLKQSKFFSKNYYRIELKTMNDDEADNYRSEIGGVVDLYLIMPDGKVAAAPGERYLITLTDEAKALIFEEVTNGIVNPQFSLEDYLVL